MKQKNKQILKILGIVIVCLIVAWNLGTKPSTTIVYTPGQIEAQKEELSKKEDIADLEEAHVQELTEIEEATIKVDPKTEDSSIQNETLKLEEIAQVEDTPKSEDVHKEETIKLTEIDEQEVAKREEPLEKVETKQETQLEKPSKENHEPQKEDSTKDTQRIEEAKVDPKAAKDLKKEIIEKSSTIKKDKYLTEPTPEGKPKPVEPENVTINKEKSFKVKLSITCETILNNMDLLDEAKYELVPEDSIIFPLQEVTAYEGESVFDVLLREVQNAGIHMEFEFTPMYNSAYIEGINNLYEFDVGELSGWMYKVNEWFPNYGCSRYQVKEGDVIEWVYTCDLGRDVGEIYIPPS